MDRKLLIAMLLLPAACRPQPPAPTAIPQPTSVAQANIPAVRGDSAAFETFLTRWLEGRGGRQERPDTLQWLRAYETAAETRAATEAQTRLDELRAIDTNGLSVPQRIDWLMAESMLKRTVYDTVLHGAQRTPGRYLTLGDLYWRVSGDRPPAPDAWNGIRIDLERAPRVLALGRQQLVAPPPLWIRLAVGTA